MDNNSPAVNASHSAMNSFLPRQTRQQLRWSGLRAAVLSPLWLGLLGSLMIMGMLLTFHQVVHGAVQQGELRHKATAAYVEASWRCNVLQGQGGAGDTCKAQLKAAYAGAGLQVQTTMLASPDDINQR